MGEMGWVGAGGTAGVEAGSYAKNAASAQASCPRSAEFSAPPELLPGWLNPIQEPSNALHMAG